MRAVIQRVSKASVSIKGVQHDSIGKGLLIFLGIEEADGMDDVDWLAKKIIQLRIFNDESGVMNISLLETGGEVLIISQFTLHAKTKKGNRPSYIHAAGPEKAIPLYEAFIQKVKEMGPKYVGQGVFGAMMEISLVNDGPVTILIDTKNKE